MKPIKILIDSTSDLSPELIAQYDFAVLPLTVNLGGETRLDGVDVNPDKLYAWARENKSIPQTSGPSPEQVEEFFEKWSRDYDVIAFPIGGLLSSTYQLMTVTAQQLEDRRITVIDPANLSTGIGLQAIYAAKNVLAGDDYDTVVEKARALVPQVRAGFVVDDVMWLYKGGRCSAMAAFAATALKLHPTLAVWDGVIKVDKKVRGNLRQAAMRYAESLEARIDNADGKVCFVTHAGVDPAIVQDLVDFVKSKNKFEEILITQAGCVIASHCGQGTIGILFAEK